MRDRLLCLTFCLVAVVLSVFGQGSNSAYRAYITQYAPMAVLQMQRYGIPASITLAQGLLESGAGRSYLAQHANNHFGIKCGSTWNGPYVLRDDDARNEHFRKYNDVSESYEDHSKFLKGKRYEPLFHLQPTDYRGWARTLKQCGYATSPTYAESLIQIIENYRLMDYDVLHVNTSYSGVGGASHVSSEEDAFFATHVVQFNNDNYYIQVQAGDDLRTIARATGVKQRKLRKFNELPRGHSLQVGDRLYLQRKHRRADRQYKGSVHFLRPGESLYDVAQLYGIQLSSLYKKNGLSEDYTPIVGQQLRIY